MIISISQAISLILALPAHRSNNIGHQKLGEEAFKLLDEYKMLGENSNESSFNRTVIALIYSAVRAFSVERDRLNGEWKAVDQVKFRRERLIDAVKKLSPFEPKNYWTILIALFASFGLSIQVDEIIKITPEKGVIIFIISLFGLEIISKTLEFIFSNIFEKAVPLKKSKIWVNSNLSKYKDIIYKFCLDYVNCYKLYFPERNTLDAYPIETPEQIEMLCRQESIRHFYL